MRYASECWVKEAPNRLERKANFLCTQNLKDTSLEAETLEPMLAMPWTVWLIAQPKLT